MAEFVLAIPPRVFSTSIARACMGFFFLFVLVFVSRSASCQFISWTGGRDAGPAASWRNGCLTSVSELVFVCSSVRAGSSDRQAPAAAWPRSPLSPITAATRVLELRWSLGRSSRLSAVLTRLGHAAPLCRSGQAHSESRIGFFSAALQVPADNSDREGSFYCPSMESFSTDRCASLP